MSNLIVTIISIALVAVATIMAAFYGGTAYSNYQINATANAIMNEAQQILQAERMWSTNNNQPDISGMGTAGASGTGMSMLVASGTLTTWPALAGGIGMSTSLTNPGPQPYIQGVGSTTTATGVFDYGCWSIQGYDGKLLRIPFANNGSNYVLYMFNVNSPTASPCTTTSGSWNVAGMVSHPIVLIAKAINTALNQGVKGSTQASGLPAVPNNNAAPSYMTYPGITVYFQDAGDTAVNSNLCFTAVTSIICVFGPS